MSLAAIPVVFLMGFWTRGAVSPTRHESVSTAQEQAPFRVAAAHHRKDNLVHHVANAPQELPVANAAVVDSGGMSHVERPDSVMPPAGVARRRPPKPSTVAANLDTVTQPFSQAVEFPAAEPAVSGQPGSPDLVDGFALRSPAAGQFVADVHVPGNSWFSLAGAAADCESGTCKLVPVKTADRKLNTALEWSSTPQLAAEQAAREGKLVFLIHVSGNFTQPGFT
jgi:hypothetical protein